MDEGPSPSNDTLQLGATSPISHSPLGHSSPDLAEPQGSLMIGGRAPSTHTTPPPAHLSSPGLSQLPSSGVELMHVGGSDRVKMTSGPLSLMMPSPEPSASFSFKQEVI